MDDKIRAVRTVLETTAPCTAIPYVLSFRLAEEEESCVIGREILRKSLQQIAGEMSLSVETVKRRRRAALEKMVLELDL